MTPSVALKNTGSFRDPTGNVYEIALENSDSGAKRILRGIDKQSLQHHEELLEQPFFRSLQKKSKVVTTKIVSTESPCPSFQQVLSDGWAGVLEHTEIPFISYPYEWSFSMLKAAALLQLNILETALENDWIVKDATPYNLSLIHI